MTHDLKDCPGEYCTIHYPRECALQKGEKKEPKTETFAPRDDRRTPDRFPQRVI